MRHTVANMGLCLALALSGAGCATAPLDQARRNFQAGNLAQADTNLAAIPQNKDAILYLMERGMVRHLRHDYTGSTRDWLYAAQLEEKLETHSLTKAGASMVVNDTMLAFRGYPFERALLRTFTARNFLARAQWDDAAVEARNALRMLENLDGFPDDAYSRYLAGLCFELAGDAGGAAVQYRLAGTLAGNLRIEEATGRLLAATGTPVAITVPSVPSGLPCELVCLVDIDGTAWGPVADYAEIVCGGRVLGTSHTLAQTDQLKWASEQRTAAKRVSKQVARIALKETIASVVENQNEELGVLLRLLLFAVEVPDVRRWETLPLRLAVARVPCPADLTAVDVVFKTGYGATVKRVTLTRPMSRKDRVFFAFCRDMP
jgi:hypothetical protein